MKKLTDFLARATLLLFEYPVSVISQLICLAGMVMGASMATHIGGVDRLVVYGAMYNISETAAEVLGVVVFFVGLALFLGFFFMHERIIQFGFYGMIVYWGFVCAMYLLEGIAAAAVFYPGLPLAILTYNLIYCTLHRKMKPSPYRVLAGKVNNA